MQVPNTEIVDLVVHGPPGSAPPVLADALLSALAEAHSDERPYRLVPRGNDPGIDAMHLLLTRPGDDAILSTCTPVFLQAPMLRGMTLTHRALTPLARLVSDHFFLVVRTDSDWKNANDLVETLPQRKTRTGGYFLGGINHLLALSIAEATGAEMEFIITPTEPAVWDALIAGEIDWGVGVGAELRPHLEAGTIRVIAALDVDRRQPFPDVPTLWELGVPVRFTMWRGLMGPPSLNEAQQAAWHARIEAMTRTQAWQDYLTRNGQVGAFLPGPAFSDFLETEWTWYEKHLTMAGLLGTKSS
jgi:putative tricarboxylic transport membrane protein